MKLLVKLSSGVCAASVCLSAACQQQNTNCQDYASVGSEIAQMAASIRGAASSSGLNQDAVQSILDGYTAKRIQLEAQNCKSASSGATPAAHPATSASGSSVGASGTTPRKTVSHPVGNVPAATQPLSQEMTKLVAPPPNPTATDNVPLAGLDRPQPPNTTANADPATCNNLPITTEVKPVLQSIGPGDNVSVSGSVPAGTNGKVQVCVNNQAVGDPVPVKTDGSFNIALGMRTDGEIVVAQLVNPGTAGSAGAFGPTSDPVEVGGAACPNETFNKDLDTPKLNPITPSTKIGEQITLSGTLTKETSGQIQLCLDGKQVPGSVIDVTSSSFTTQVTTSQATPMTAGQKVQAQYLEPASDGKAAVYGPPTADVLIGSCSQAASQAASTGATPATPKLNVVLSGDATNTATYSGTVEGAKSGRIRICVNDVPLKDASNKDVGADIDAGGNFTSNKNGFKVDSSDTITAQVVNSGAPETYGPISNAVAIVAGLTAPDTNPFVGSFIAGVEQSGYSSLGNSTEPFLSAFLRSPYRSKWNIASWGRIRLLGAPQPSTENGITSILTNPTGALQSTSFSSIGAAVDYVVGPEVKIHKYSDASGISFVAGLGATTPLNSNNVAVTYNAPQPNTVECAQLVSEFGQGSGYVPYLVANPNNSGDTSENSCIYNPVSKNPYKFVSFANENRTNFLFKWGMGGRFTHVFPAKDNNPSYTSALDLSVGQDSSITGGLVRGWVYKFDGMFPLALGKSSLMYVFGSAELRFRHDKMYPPLILSPGTMVPALPDPSVIVLPLKQPNRDFYRLGFGVNLATVWCAFSSAGCAAGGNAAKEAPAGTSAGSTPTPPTKKPTTPATGKAQSASHPNNPS